jgi:excisionase family DNA binding protein
MDREFLTKAEMADRLRITLRTLTNMMNRHEIPYLKVGKRVLFRKSDIDKWLESKRIGS